jgi:very-short-patch-repair endonuclease
MTSSPSVRDVEGADEPFVRETSRGSTYVAVVGIDRYRAWSKLQRAVNDARGARDVFVKLGFKEFRPALFDEAATGTAMQRLVTDELRALGSEDSLVVFFAGHGHTVTTPYPDGTVTKLGFLVPVDAEPLGVGVGALVSLDNWLHHLAHLKAKHILVVIDACHSGIALNPVIRWRGEDVRTSEPLDKLRARRSRRIITSALDNELAMDGGPIEGHSLFTGCLIEALTGGLRAKTGQRSATGSEIALHVQRRVSSFPTSHQTPDFGALELDNRGELLIDLSESPATTQRHGVDSILPVKRGPGSSAGVSESSRLSGDAVRTRTPSAASGVDSIQSRRAKTDPSAATLVPDKAYSPSPANASERPPAEDVRLPRGPAEMPAGADAQVAAVPAASAQPASEAGKARTQASGAGIRTTGAEAIRPAENKPSSDRTPNRVSPAELAVVAALDRHQAARQRGIRVLSFVTADPMTGMTGWASWAASRGHLTLATEATGLGTVTASLLGQMPWLRILRVARSRVAEVAKLDLNAVDAALDARSSSDREAWIDEVAGHEVHARVSGWLLSMVREPWGRVPDLGAAPVQGGALLAALCEIAAPIAILLHHPEPTAAWLERAIETAADLVEFLPGRAIAVAAPGELAASVLRGRSESRALVLVRQGEVPLTARAPRVTDPARSRAVSALHGALARDPRTAGLFEPTVRVPTHDRDRAVVVDLIARDALLAVEIDDWYLFRDPQAYARDRAKDMWLSRAQFFVMRFLVEDVGERIGQTVDEIAIALAGRRASGSFVEDAK